MKFIKIGNDYINFDLVSLFYFVRLEEDKYEFKYYIGSGFEKVSTNKQTIDNVLMHVKTNSHISSMA